MRRFWLIAALALLDCIEISGAGDWNVEDEPPGDGESPDPFWSKEEVFDAIRDGDAAGSHIVCRCGTGDPGERDCRRATRQGRRGVHLESGQAVEPDHPLLRVFGHYVRFG